MRRTMMLMTMMRMEKVDHMAGESNDVDDHDENLRMESLGDPGASCLSTVSSSSSVNSVLPPRLLCMYLMNISLIPFSLLQVPHIMGNTCEVPGGATAIIELLTLLTQSSEGNQPSAGLFAIAFTF